MKPTDKTGPTDGDTPIAFARPDIDPSDLAAVSGVLESGWLTTGSECLAFEDELSDYLAAPVAALSSCTAALEISMAWLDLPAGARVGVPTWTFASSALAPFHAGAEVVLLDVDEDSLNVAPTSLETALDDGLDAVIGVHFAGVPFVEAIHAQCADAGVPLIEDAAHALGASDHRGRIAGEGSVSACFSFYATKNLTTGEGGAISGSQDLVDFARSYRQHGMSREAWNRYSPDGEALYDLVSPGIKANMPDLLAALGRSQLRRYDEMQATRRHLVDRYRVNLAATDIRPVPTHAAAGSADHLMVVMLPEGVDRAATVKYLSAAGIGSSVHFQPLHQFGWFRQNTTVGPGGVPTADRLASRALSLPLHPGLTDGDVDRVCQVLQECV